MLLCHAIFSVWHGDFQTWIIPNPRLNSLLYGDLHWIFPFSLGLGLSMTRKLAHRLYLGGLPRSMDGYPSILKKKVFYLFDCPRQQCNQFTLRQSPHPHFGGAVWLLLWSPQSFTSQQNVLPTVEQTFTTTFLNYIWWLQTVYFKASAHLTHFSSDTMLRYLHQIMIR